MMKQLRLLVLALGLVTCFASVPVSAADEPKKTGVWGACEKKDNEICNDQTEAKTVVKNLINVFLYVIGILSVIMIIHSGFKYVNSRGDAEGVKSAKNTLLYSIIGLIVALLAFTIVNFVVGIFMDPEDTETGRVTTQGRSEYV